MDYDKIINAKLRYDMMDDKCMEFSGVITDDLSSLMEPKTIEK
jgi:hypothetical protein